MSSLQVITAPAKDWIAALNRLTPAMSGKKSMPILNFIVVNPAKLTLSGYNFETSAVTGLLSAEGSGDPFLVSWRWLLDAIRTTSGKTKTAPATVSLDGTKITVSSCGYELHAETANLSEYPEIPNAAPSVESMLPPAALRAALRRARVAASADDTLPLLQSVQVNMLDGGIELLATDRYRLANDYVSGVGEGEASFLLSRSTIKAIDRFITGETVSIGIRERHISIITETTTYTSLAVDGDYPKIRSLFPDEVTGAFEVDRTVLIEAAKVALTMNTEYSPCCIDLSKDGGQVTFDYGLFGPSKSPTAAGGCVAGAADPIRFAMNPKYLIESLQQITTDIVRISYTSLPKPFLFSPQGVAAGDEKALKYLIMPVRMPQ